MGKLTISMAMFNSFLYVYQRVHNVQEECARDCKGVECGSQCVGPSSQDHPRYEWPVATGTDWRYLVAHPTARKWVMTPVINGISRVNPLIIGVN